MMYIHWYSTRQSVKAILTTRIVHTVLVAQLSHGRSGLGLLINRHDLAAGIRDFLNIS